MENGFGCVRRWEGRAGLAVGLAVVCVCDYALHTVYPTSETRVIQEPKHGPGSLPAAPCARACSSVSSQCHWCCSLLLFLRGRCRGCH